VIKETVSKVCQEMANLPKSDKASADHLTDFAPPIYNIWKFKEKTRGTRLPAGLAGGLQAKSEAKRMDTF